MPQNEQNEKLDALLNRLKELGSVVVALSGGVDSSTLAKAAQLALGDRAVAITANSELMAKSELTDAKNVAEAVGIRHLVVDAHDLDCPELTANDRNRCYYCKRGRFDKLCAWARAHGFAFVADGGNLDDKGDFRPGMRAIEELAPMVVSPLMECGWTKADIRRQAREWGLAVSEKPSAACLASRIEYGLALTPARLRQVGDGETFLRPLVKGQLRVRHHGNLARIEVEKGALSPILENRESITAELKRLGFTYITLDLIGYRMGSTNEA